MKELWSWILMVVSTCLLLEVLKVLIRKHRTIFGQAFLQVLEARVSLSFARTWTLRTETRLLKDALQDKLGRVCHQLSTVCSSFYFKRMYVLAVKSQPHMKPNSQCASTVLVNFPFWPTHHRVLRCSNAKISSSPSSENLNAPINTNTLSLEKKWWKTGRPILSLGDCCIWSNSC